MATIISIIISISLILFSFILIKLSQKNKTDEEKYSIDRYAGKWKKHDRRIARKSNQLSVYRR